jgi:hypothetical protein
MRNYYMKQLYLAAFLAVGLSISALAVQTTPLNTKGESLDSTYAGVKTCEITSSTGTAALLCATGSGIVIDVYASSVAVTDTIVFRDSATANTSSTVLLAITQANIAARHIYPRFNNGLSVNALVSPTAAGTGISRPNWTVIYTQDVK